MSRGLDLAFLLLASGCLDSVAVPFEPHPDARTTVLINERELDGEWRAISGFVFDHASEWRGLPLSFGRDDRLVALSYRHPLGSLQLEAGVLFPNPEGERVLPAPDLSAIRRDAPLASSSWVEISDVPLFRLPDYSMSRCADDRLCLRSDRADFCTTCTAQPVTPLPEEPMPAQVEPHVRLEACAPGFAHFSGAAGCEPVGGGCPELPGAPVVTTAAELLRELGAGTATIALAAATFELPATPLVGPAALIGCGADSVLRLPPDGTIVIQAGAVTLKNLRIEAGQLGLVVLPPARASLEAVSIDGAGAIGLHSEGELIARRVSVEGRAVGVQIVTGRSSIEQLALRDTALLGVYCLGDTSRAPRPQIALVDFALRGTPSDPNGRAIHASGCEMSMEGGVIEGGRRVGIDVAGPGTDVTRIADVTIRDIDGSAPVPLQGGIWVHGAARLREISRVWIEGVDNLGINAVDQDELRLEDLVIRDVRARGTPAFGVRIHNSTASLGRTTLERVDVAGVQGGALFLEAARYQAPPSTVSARDLRIESAATARPALSVRRVDADMTRVRITGGDDAIVVSNGSDSRMTDLLLEGAAGRALTLEADSTTTLRVEDVLVSGAQTGIHVFGRIELDFFEPLELRAARVAATGCSGYGVLVEGAPLELEGFLLSGNQIGIGVAERSAVFLRQGGIQGHAVGARVVPSVNQRNLVTTVEFSENARGIEVVPAVP